MRVFDKEPHTHVGAILLHRLNEKTPPCLAGRGSFQYKAWRRPTLTWDLPHYHRRWRFSLLSSGWDQVVQRLYDRQAIRFAFVLSYAFIALSFDLSQNTRIRAWIFNNSFWNRDNQVSNRCCFHRNSMCLCHFDDLEPSLFSSKTTLVLYGQASRAISIG